MKWYLYGLSIGSIVCVMGLSTWQTTRADGLAASTTSAAAKADADALHELLMKGLKVTRPDQEKYVDRVVGLVATEKLPVSMVYAAFRYARRRRPDYPFPYFQFALQTLAKRKNIKI